MASVDPFAPDGVEWTAVSPRLASVRRLIALVTLSLEVLLVTGVALWVGPDWRWRLVLANVVLAGLLLAWLWRAIGRNVAALGYTERADDLLVRRGVVLRELVAVPYGRMQFVDVQSGPLQRAYGVATVQLHTAAAATDASIPGLVPEEAARLRDRLAARGEAQAAGL